MSVALDSGTKNGYIYTRSGKLIQPLNLDPAALDIEDIAHSLAHQCRFTGHTREFYSVAQHSVLCAEHMASLGSGRNLTLCALLHDASEAYMSDIARPLKRLECISDGYALIENILQKAICEKWEVQWPLPELVHVVDNMLLARECHDLMPPALAAEWVLSYSNPVPKIGFGWSPVIARRRFMERFRQLTGEYDGR